MCLYILETMSRSMNDWWLNVERWLSATLPATPGVSLLSVTTSCDAPKVRSSSSRVPYEIHVQHGERLILHPSRVAAIDKRTCQDASWTRRQTSSASRGRDCWWNCSLSELQDDRGLLEGLGHSCCCHESRHAGIHGKSSFTTMDPKLGFLQEC